MNEPLLVEMRGASALVTLNRPEAINAVNDAIRCAFPVVMNKLDADDAVRAIILAGAGERGFCAGADIKETRADNSPVAQRARLMPTSWIESIDRVAKPVISVIHGLCLGGGLEIALACDLRIASSDSHFALPETALGLIPGGGGTQRLPRLIGFARALDMLLTGERIDAAEAFRIGLVTRLAETRADALDEALRIAALIATRPPVAIAYCKEAAMASCSTQLQAGLQLEKGLFALLSGTEDRVEAAAAFREKRPPDFTGR